MSLLRRPVRRDDPLRVLYIVPDLGVGGAERQVVTLLPALDNSRFAPSVICIGDEGPLFPALVEAGVSARALHRSKRQFLPALAGLLGEMRRIQPDLVLLRGYNAEVLGRVAAALTRVPRSVIWIHNSFGLAPRGLVRRLADRVLDPLTSAYYGVAYAQLPYLTDELGYPAAKIRIIQNGVDPARFAAAAVERDPVLAEALGIGPGDPVVGTVAALRPEKDHATLLRACRLVVDEIPTARVLIVGDGPRRRDLENLTAELDLAGNVVFAGTSSDVGRMLQVMDVFALTSRSECFPIAVLEAMAAGRPVVATAVGGLPEMVEEGIGGYLVPPRDAAALAARLIPLLRDREQARSMGRAARDWVVSEFSLDRSLRRAERALEETAGRVEAADVR